jgi:hypothetical protein
VFMNSDDHWVQFRSDSPSDDSPGELLSSLAQRRIGTVPHIGKSGSFLAARGLGGMHDKGHLQLGIVDVAARRAPVAQSATTLQPRRLKGPGNDQLEILPGRFLQSSPTPHWPKVNVTATLGQPEVASIPLHKAIPGIGPGRESRAMSVSKMRLFGRRACAKCGHPRDVHVHIRRGRDCGDCSCSGFRWVAMKRHHGLGPRS